MVGPAKHHVSAKAVAYLCAGGLLLGLGAFFNRPSLALFGAFPVLLVVLNLRGATVRRVQAERIFDTQERRFEGTNVPVRLDVSTGSRRLRVAEVRDRLPPHMGLREGSNYRVVGMRRSRPVRLTYTVEGHLFGLHDLGPLEVRLEDPYGFFAQELRFGEPRAVRLDPRPPGIDAAAVASVLPQPYLGQHEVSQPGSGFDFFGLRDYARSDRMRDVNWKATARVGRLVVNQHVRESKADVLLLLSARSSELIGSPRLSSWAQSGRMAVEVAQELLQRRDSLRICAYGANVEQVRRTGPGRQLQALLDLLVETQPRGHLPLNEAVDVLLPSIAAKAPVIVFSSLLADPTADRALLRLLSAGNAVVVISPRPGFGAGQPSAADRAFLAERNRTLQHLREYGAIVMDLEPDATLGVAA